jgi:hypothetical protein
MESPVWALVYELRAKLIRRTAGNDHHVNREHCAMGAAPAEAGTLT